MIDGLSHAVDALHPAAHATARDLTPRFRRYATRHGAPHDLIDKLQVTWNATANRFEMGVTDERHREAFEDAEYGGLDGRPGAFTRSFDRALARDARRLMDEHLGRRL
jgi:hypothetical protein